MIELPSDLRSIPDRIIDCVQRGMPIPDDANELINWIETELWDNLIEAWNPEYIVLKLYSLSQFRFLDSELIDDGESLDIVTDEDRIIHARNVIDRAFEEMDGYDCPSVHSIKFEDSDGASAVLGWLVEIHGQNGPVAEYQGAFYDAKHFYQNLRDSDYLFSHERDSLTDETILRLWNEEN